MKTNIAKIAFYITIITLISKLLGFGRDIVMAAVFGTTSVMDNFVMATSILGVVTAMLMGALSTTFLPVYAEYHEKKDEATRLSFLNTVFTVSFVIAILMGLVALAFPRFLVSVFAPQFSSEDAAMTARLIQVLTPVILLTLFVTLDTAVLQVNGSFLAAVAIGFPANIVLILGMLLMTRHLGIYALVLSTLFGTAAQAIMLWIAKRKYRLPIHPKWNLKDEGVRRIGILVIPILLGSGISQINTFVDRSLASGLPAGSISAMNFSNRLSSFVLGLISASVVSVFYASMSNMTANGQDANYKSLLRNTVNGIFLILVPATAGMIALRLPIVRVIFEHGVFDRSASEMTAAALLFYSIGLIGFALRDVFSRSFYARKDTKTTMINGLFAVVVNIVLAVTLTPSMGLGGLVLASSVSGLVGTILLGWSLYRKIGDYGLGRIASVFVKVAAASIVMAFAARGLYEVLIVWSGSNLLSLGVSMVVAVVVYIGIVLLLRIDEVHKVTQLIYAKIGRLMPVSTPQEPGSGM